MSRLLKRRRFVPLLLGDPEFAGDGDDDGGGSGGTTPGDELLPDPVIVADAVPSMRIAQHSEYEAANDWEHGAQWTVTNAGTWTDPSGGATGYMRTEPAAGAIAGRDTILADWYADHNPVFNCFVFPQTITNMRYFVGFTNLTLANQLALRIPAGIYFGFVFDSAVDTYWSCVCSDGVGYTEQPG
ncbi:MAG: hypothetical protein ACWGQW_21325, partial [bacterium]